MKVEINPLEPLRAAAEKNVNRMFNELGTAKVHQDAIYAHKRVWATNDRVKLKAEADLKGISQDELAELILQQPDILHARELRRQKQLKAVREAKTVEELMAIKGDLYD